MVPSKRAYCIALGSVAVVIDHPICRVSNKKLIRQEIKEYLIFVRVGDAMY